MNAGADMPPHSLEAEQSVLGAVMLDNTVIERIALIVAPEHFYNDGHRTVYEHELRLHERGDPIDVITLQDSLATSGKLDYVGGLTYLASLFENVPTAKNAEHYAGIVARHAGRRKAAGATDETSSEQDEPTERWPAPLDECAFHGIVGELVRMIEPNSEADPVALLLQSLVSFGNYVGRGPHVRVEGDQHHANLFAILIGATSKARKGTSWGRVRSVFSLIPDWKPTVSGLSSGEGLKFNIRDAREETKTNKKGERITEVVDDGVSDKRLLVIESEFASALRSIDRTGNTLSSTVRDAFDTGTLSTLTKNDPIVATEGHVSIIGHITVEELRAELTATDTANGFANRFLFAAVRRSRSLPFGGDADAEEKLQKFANGFQKRALNARKLQAVSMTPDACKVWIAVYPELSAGGEGLHGAATARAEALCLRLALVYCLADGAQQIGAPHLLAALAIWNYCNDTARYIFGSSLGDRVADEILRRLKRAGAVGVTRTEISAGFGRNLSAERIGAALDLLMRKGLAKGEMVSTGGRPSEVWKVAK